MSGAATETGEEVAPKGVASRLARLLGRAFGGLSTAIILVVLVLTAMNVAARYLFGAPMRGAEEGTGFLVVAIVMFGAAEAYRRGDHIRIDILSGKFGERLGSFIEGVSHLVVAVLGALLAWTGWHTVGFSYAFGAYSSGYLEIPLWIPQSALVIGGVILALLAALRFLAMFTEERV